MAKEYYQSPRWSGEIADCGMPMTMDTYSNCAFGCAYCFSQYQRGVGKPSADYNQHANVKHVNVEAVKKIFLELDNPRNQFAEYIRQRKVLQWGGLSDQFDPVEKKLRVTYELLKFFREIEYPISFSTKATWFMDDPEYIELFQGAHFWNIKWSIVTLDRNKSKRLEKGVPSPMDRIKAIEKFAKMGNPATLRLRPFMIGISTPDYPELIKISADHGATALTTEFFCLEQRATKPKHLKNYALISELCGFDVLAYYKKYSTGSGYLRLNRNIKRIYVAHMKRVAKENGMRFAVSDAHFKEESDNGACCALPSDWAYSQGQWTEALMIAKKDGEVRFSQMAEKMGNLFDFMWNYATSFNTGSVSRRQKYKRMSMKEYLRSVWNDPNNGQSPYKMFEGIVKPKMVGNSDGSTDVFRDENRDIVYFYNPEKGLNLDTMSELLRSQDSVKLPDSNQIPCGMRGPDNL